jgi:hypothetical protein
MVQTALVHVEGDGRGDGHEETRSLYRWLVDETAVRTYGEPQLVSAPRSPETMGNLDVITCVLNAGVSTAQVIAMIIGWRRSRPVSIAVTVTCGDKTVRVDDDDPGNAEKLADQIDG